MFSVFNSKPSKVNAVLITEENIGVVCKAINGELITKSSNTGVKTNAIEFTNFLHQNRYTVCVGEYVCKLSDDDLYPCNAEIFVKKYDFSLDGENKPDGVKIDCNDAKTLSSITKNTINDLTEEATKKFDYAHSMAIEGLKKVPNSKSEIDFMNVCKVPMRQGFINGYINALTAYKVVKLSAEV